LGRKSFDPDGMSPLSNQDQTNTPSTKHTPSKRFSFGGVVGVSAYSLASDSFLPHGFCFQWKTALIWLDVVSDTLIAAAYLAIPVLLFYFAKKRSDLKFRWVFVCSASSLSLAVPHT